MKSNEGTEKNTRLIVLYISAGSKVLVVILLFIKQKTSWQIPTRSEVYPKSFDLSFFGGTLFSRCCLDKVFHVVMIDCLCFKSYKVGAKHGRGCIDSGSKGSENGCNGLK